MIIIQTKAHFMQQRDTKREDTTESVKVPETLKHAWVSDIAVLDPTLKPIPLAILTSWVTTGCCPDNTQVWCVGIVKYLSTIHKPEKSDPNTIKAAEESQIGSISIEDFEESDEPHSSYVATTPKFTAAHKFKGYPRLSLCQEQGPGELESYMTPTDFTLKKPYKIQHQIMHALGGIITDSAILNSTPLKNAHGGEAAIQNFNASHYCSSICRLLGPHKCDVPYIGSEAKHALKQCRIQNKKE
ncbi:hypothetical protein DFH28DRAFT_923211 [Melampsora americana]|nr:hypothetical protein DFH28DRAFT_923211 [Melampsora americana]